jgi:type I restriction enzyme R subunit
MVESFQKFIDENRDEITALQIFYRKPYGDSDLTLEQIKQLAEAIE